MTLQLVPEQQSVVIEIPGRTQKELCIYKREQLVRILKSNTSVELQNMKR